MSKTKEELDAIKEEVNSVNEKLHELTEEDLEQVAGGVENGFRTSHEIHKIGLWDYEDLKDLSPCE